jgi:hypothetical protein
MITEFLRGCTHCGKEMNCEMLNFQIIMKPISTYIEATAVLSPPAAGTAQWL